MTWLKPARLNAAPAVTPEDLEREISAISDESHGLAEAVARVRSDLEQAKVEDGRKIVHLEEVRQSMQQARDEDRRKLAELESDNDRYSRDRDADRRELDALTERVSGLEAERDHTRGQLEAMQAALQESESRQEQAFGQIRDLQANAMEQAREFRSAIAEAGERLTAADNKIRVFGSRLDSEHRQILKTFEELQARLRRQDTRISWTIVIGVSAVLLAAAVGAVLFWETQRNTALLADMSRDIHDLAMTVNERLTAQQSQRQLPPPPVEVVPPGPSTTAPARPQPAPPAAGSKAKPAEKPLSLTSIVDRGRLTNRVGARQATRQDADSFFAENARIPGMITLDSGVQYRVLKAGGGAAPAAQDKVVVAYVGTKLDGTVIDETYSSGAPSTFTMAEVLPAWREVLLKMEAGSEFELYIPPVQAGRSGVRNRSVTGYEPTIYLIELIEVIKAPAAAD